MPKIAQKCQKSLINCVKNQKLAQLWKISTSGACAACIFFHLWTLPLSSSPLGLLPITGLAPGSPGQRGLGDQLTRTGLDSCWSGPVDQCGRVTGYGQATSKAISLDSRLTFIRGRQTWPNHGSINGRVLESRRKPFPEVGSESWSRWADTPATQVI